MQLDKLKDRYQKSLQNHYNHLQDALKNHSYEELEEISHKIKGSAAIYGYPQLSQLSNELFYAVSGKKLLLSEDLTKELIANIEAVLTSHVTSNN